MEERVEVLLGFVGVVFVFDLFDADFHAVFGEGDVLLLHPLLAGVADGVRNDIDLEECNAR